MTEFKFITKEKEENKDTDAISLEIAYQLKRIADILASWSHPKGYLSIGNRR